MVAYVIMFSRRGFLRKRIYQDLAHGVSQTDSLFTFLYRVDNYGVLIWPFAALLAIRYREISFFRALFIQALLLACPDCLQSVLLR